jgi:hypothetical protein
MQRITTSSFQRDGLSYGLLLMHLAVMIYVLIGWTSDSRLALFLYQLVLPGLALQWLFNRGSSLLSNCETYLRTEHWRDSRNVEEGAFLQNLVERACGLKASQAQIMTVVYSLMLMFWALALLRMTMIIPAVHLLPL